MYNDKTFIGIIPARSGSKGLPGKNIRPLAGKPLLEWTILAALQSGVIDELHVSTDSEKYTEIAVRCGAKAPFLRPAHLSLDDTPASEYIIYTLNEYRGRFGECFDYFVLLQPTTPFRSATHILEGVKMAVDENLTSVVSYSPYETDIKTVGSLADDMRLSSFTPVCSASASPNDSLRQKAGNLYQINGMLYICRCDVYLNTKSFYSPGGKAYIIDSKYALDIDCEADFAYAEYLAEKNGWH